MQHLYRFDSRLGLILIFDLDLALIPTIFFCNRGGGGGGGGRAHILPESAPEKPR